ncbi:defective in Cullin neddylation protein 1 [Thelephora terrestris]|uniref:Defective in cullin neddylation protein n=1 Tax=Thelephora terrestris TaxID=56493 RepID=A0A9P6L675_9AGAM|nr:defective in Cullin neddylation protein 1 [Thelephora terrestris]
MSKKSKISEDLIAQFCGITGASVKSAKKYLGDHKRIDSAIDAYYTEGGESSSSRVTPNAVADPQRLNQVYDVYKDSDGDEITVGGALKWFEALGVDPEDVVLLPLAYELKSPTVGSFPRKPWIDGWKSLGCDSIPTMKEALPRLRDKLANNRLYFTSVYNYTFEFAKTGGQRSIGVETAIAFWGLLIPHGLTGPALAHDSDEGTDDDDDDEPMGAEEGWQPKFTDWWFEFLTTKGGKGVSKDTWAMFLDFVRTIDSEFKNHDYDAAWPSSIDDFVMYVRKEKLGFA